MKKSENIFITNTLSNKLKSTNESSELSNKERRNEKCEKELKEKGKIMENFFDFLINENPNYADFDKVIEYYENKLRNNERIFNQNLDIIKTKKIENEKIQKHIYDIILNNVKLTNPDIDLYYQNLIEKYKKEITLTQHELEVYKNTFNDIYKSNYLLSARLENENKTEKIFGEQYEKYVNIRDAALTKLLKQEEMLKTLNFYFEKVLNINKSLILKKEKKLKQLNYEIHVLKNDEEKNEKTLKNLMTKNSNINDYINKQKYKYLIYLKDYKNIIKSYIKDKNSLNKIDELIRESNIDNIINQYNDLKYQNKELSTLFSLRSKRIINLNTTITNLNKEYDYIKNSIKIKEKIEKEETKNNIISHDDKIDKINLLKNQIINYIEEGSNVFWDKFKFLINFIYFTINLIESINHSRKCSINASNFECLSFDNRNNLIEKNVNFFNNNYNNNFKIDFDTQFFNKNFLKFLIFLINELSFQAKSIITNVFRILNQRQKEKNIEKKNLDEMKIFETIQPNNLSSNKINKEINFDNNIVSEFNFNNFRKLFRNELIISKKKLEERKQFFELEEKELFNKKLKNEKKFKKEEIFLPSIDKNALSKNRSMDNISTKDFLYQYYQYYNKNGKNEMNNSDKKIINFKSNFKSMINLNKFNFVLDFTNDFVSNKKEYEDKKIEKYREILKKSKKIKEDLEKKEIDKYLKKSAKIKKLIREQYKNEISSDSEKEEKQKKDELALQIIAKELSELKKPKKFKVKYQDQDTSKIFERYDDIRALELNFIKNKGNFLIDSGFFNEHYFKLKKQFNKNNTKRRLFNKIMNKNYKNININSHNNNILSRSMNDINKLNKEFKNEKNDDFYKNNIKFKNANNKGIFLKKINKISFNNNLENTTSRKSEK